MCPMQAKIPRVENKTVCRIESWKNYISKEEYYSKTKALCYINFVIVIIRSIVGDALPRDRNIV